MDYFSLDIEGAEHVALNTIPWDHLKDVTLLSVEVNHAGDIFPGSHFLHFLQPKDLDSWAWLHMHDHRNLPKNVLQLNKNKNELYDLKKPSAEHLNNFRKSHISLQMQLVWLKSIFKIWCQNSQLHMLLLWQIVFRLFPLVS